jgi:hypothetical protein
MQSIQKKIVEYVKVGPAMKKHSITVAHRDHYARLLWLWTTLSLLCILLLSVIINPLLTFLSFSENQPFFNIRPVQATENIVTNGYLFAADPAHDANHQQWRELFNNIPAVSRSPRLTITNYTEDRAVREAVLADVALWKKDPHLHQWYFSTSTGLHVHLKNPDRPLSAKEVHSHLTAQSERTVITARIVMGLWLCRRYDARFSSCGRVAIRADEILQWRGVQKHQRRAYAGSNKRFSDGYQWKHKQQVVRDLQLLQLYYLRGYHTIVDRGKVQHMLVDSPYLYLTPLQEVNSGGATIVGYLAAPGNWIDDYETYNNGYLTDVNRRVFQLNPQNDRLALRIALYLVEHWRHFARGQKYNEPLLMADLLAASMIPIDKANLTSRFAPRVEAALQKLYDQGILGDAPVCLSSVDKTKAHWGADWLAAYWRIVPPQ